jgi:hypothetical protein
VILQWTLLLLLNLALLSVQVPTRVLQTRSTWKMRIINKHHRQCLIAEAPAVTETETNYKVYSHHAMFLITVNEEEVSVDDLVMMMMNDVDSRRRILYRTRRRLVEFFGGAFCFQNSRFKFDIYGS